MSHVATVEIEIKDLDALRVACKRIGLEFREGQKKYKWYGHHVGDYPLPAGFTQAELGRCDHALAVPNADKNTYEVGVVKRKDGPGFVLLWDFFAGGMGLEEVVGPECSKLRQAYAVEVAKKKAIQGGFMVTEKQLAGGKIQLVCNKMG